MHYTAPKQRSEHLETWHQPTKKDLRLEKGFRLVDFSLQNHPEKPRRQSKWGYNSSFSMEIWHGGL
jgi:hypothetical protein